MGGNQTSKQIPRQSLTELLISHHENIHPQLAQNTYSNQGCCCCLRRGEVEDFQPWKKDFIECCDQLEKQFLWVRVLLKVASQAKEERVQSLKEFVELKNEFSRKCRDHQLPSQSEMIEMLKSSVLLQQGKQGPDVDRSRLSSFISRKDGYERPKPTTPSKINLMVSMVNQSMKTLFTPATKKDEQYQSSIYFFVKFTQILQRHCSNKNGVLGKLISQFTSYIQSYWQQNRLAQTSQNQKYLIKSINSFVDLYSILIHNYYKLSLLSDNNKVKFSFRFQNLKSASMTILFKIQGFYQKVFAAFKCNDHKEEKQLKQVMIKNKDIKPQDLKISNQFCLNQMTMAWYTNRESVSQGVDNIEIPVIIENSPYTLPIQKLKQIDEARTPISKLKVIISAATKISKQINRFYSTNNIIKQQMVDSDQILSIFMYIILKSNNQTLITHLRFVENFCTEQQLMSDTGYYSKVAEAAIRAILSKEADVLGQGALD